MSATRRAAFRVKVPEPGWLTATIVNEQGEQVGAVVLDLSRMGMGAKVSSAMPMPSGQRLQCRLSFDDTEVDTEATVRHCQADESATRLGLEFTSVTPVLDTVLSRVVFQLQRYLLRRRSGSRPGLLR